MPAIYILDIPEFEPILRTALIAGMEQEDLDGYLRVSTSESEIVLERRHTDVRPAVWFAALTGGLEGRIVHFDFDRLHLAEVVPS
ncbi:MULTISPECIES: hypothetical protein [unclassified Streptomyces]|uniref:hypothetical protein n=1 Tax=unclassified Streptomyces TaxID=2593676 RepID=UPI002DDB8662|nr:MULTISPECIES: hypothetical protein [unclassified Streptomyces]WSA70715.1 hypothetical protein OIE65_29190 [Streptomyces sp. NBC_01800]WSA79213.1 hypothetical protein OG930_28515 [Streptomyces sp. NBC_01799]